MSDFTDFDDEEVNDYNSKPKCKKSYTLPEMKERLKRYGWVYGRNSY